MKQRKGLKSKWLLPDFIAKNVTEIDFGYLKNKGIQACFFDLDHTLLDQGTHVVSDVMIEQLREAGMCIYIATNRRYSDSLDKVAKQVDADGIMHAEKGGISKPRRAYYQRLIELAGVKPENIAMIGDRIIQDIYGANRAGVTSVLVSKLGPISLFDRILIIPDQIIPKLFVLKYFDV